MSHQADFEQRWIGAWRNASSALEAIHVKELRELDYQQKQDAILGLLELGHRFRRPRESSGMVEMQRLFKKARP